MEERLATTYHMGMDLADMFSYENENTANGKYLRDCLQKTLEPVVGNLQRESISEFTLGKVLGSGGYAKVYQAKRNRDGKCFAIKKQSTQLGGYNAIHERDVMIKLGKSITPELFYSFMDATHTYLVMELMRGTLHAANLPRPMLLYSLHSLAVVMDEVHKKGFIHLDIKPDNVLFSHNWSIKIGDCGWAKNCRKNEICKRSQGLAATLSFAAPETFKGTASFKSDYWSYGLTAAPFYFDFYQLLVPSKMDFSSTFQWITTPGNILARLNEIRDTEMRMFVAQFLKINQDQRPNLSNIIWPTEMVQFQAQTFRHDKFISEIMTNVISVWKPDIPQKIRTVYGKKTSPSTVGEKIQFVGIYYNKDDPVCAAAKLRRDQRLRFQKLADEYKLEMLKKDKIIESLQTRSEKFEGIAADLESLKEQLALKTAQNKDLNAELTKKSDELHELELANVKVVTAGNIAKKKEIRKTSKKISSATTVTETEKQKIFVCATCKATFNEIKYMTKHQQKHSEPTFSCNSCSRKFHHHFNLKQHERTHSEIRNFICLQCNKGYKHPAGLKQHQKSNPVCKPK